VTTTDATRLAVLIDADNASASLATKLLEEIARYGTPTIKRAYGDWTTQQLAAWKAELLRHAIQPMQQFGYTRGKNSTDSTLIIDAMDLLYAGNVEGFVIVSSDSDFTRLATRLRESGMTVYGLGRRDTPEPFVAACDRFIYLDLLSQQPQDKEPALPGPELKGMLSMAIASTSKEDGWSHLGEVGSYLVKSHAAFDPRAYGHAKLGEAARRHGRAISMSPAPPAPRLRGDSQRNLSGLLPWHGRLEASPHPSRSPYGKPQVQARHLRRRRGRRSQRRRDRERSHLGDGVVLVVRVHQPGAPRPRPLEGGSHVQRQDGDAPHR